MATGTHRSAPALPLCRRDDLRCLDPGVACRHDRRAPIALWEFSLGVWLIVKGFSPSPITAGMTTPDAPAHRDATA